ncbi:putative MFS family arabinose efflux permease [Paraburkholderia eburnea]|uniref:Putative MFS family arabinose efflux permease n=1 Tax=Paraburkholderia eburnea TaxID=1189126 RepID=A0A2S4LW88_9BURK|nr:MFS transporter [Paraburkholderia eburnea]POR46718.1 putative MFS family arabinose efflux permease [Paraburkholderia eburnea]PRZ17907.1 putative MFS family arabinose efflux permease [Paraburkholderia eburnea]
MQIDTPTTPVSLEGTPTSASQWLSVVAVAMSAFAFVTAEFLPVGLLPQIAHDLGVSTGVAGLMVTTPGVMAAISAPMLIVSAGRMDRRYVFLLLTAVLLIANVLCAIAPGFAVMLTGRALLGAALGGFWTLATAAAPRLVQGRDAAKATATILTGVTCATVIGVPLGTFIASFSSWRLAFAATAGLVALALVAQALLVPSLPSASALRLADFRKLLGRSHTRLSMLMVALVFGAHFSTYTYIAPLLEHDFSLNAMTLLLLGFGLIGFFSNALTSTVISDHLKKSVATMVLLLLAALSSMLLLEHSPVGETVGMLLWGIAFGALPLCFSVWIQRDTTDLPEAGSAMFVSVIQVAIAAGSAVGGTIVDRAGVHADFLLGLGLALLGLVTLQRLAASRQPAKAASLDCACDASLD